MKVPIIAHIRHNPTGEIRRYETNLWVQEVDEGGIPDPYIWEYGNYSCDCNRDHFFRHAGGEEWCDVECSDGEYSVNLELVSNKSIFYQEFKE